MDRRIKSYAVIPRFILSCLNQAVVSESSAVILHFTLSSLAKRRTLCTGPAAALRSHCARKLVNRQKRRDPAYVDESIPNIKARRMSTLPWSI
jgi:hypothetical protein